MVSNFLSSEHHLHEISTPDSPLNIEKWKIFGNIVKTPIG